MKLTRFLGTRFLGARFLGATGLGLLPVLLAACSGSGGGTENGSGGGNATATDFSATLDMAQELPAPVVGVDLEIIATNVSTPMGTFQTPVWFGIHNGTFDTYDLNATAMVHLGGALERIAEDGEAGPLSAEFTTQGRGRLQSVIAGPAGPYAPGDSGNRTVRINPFADTSRFFSYVSMVLPSNDAFIANDDPLAHQLFDASGVLVFNSTTIAGNQVLDAGTEVNDELPANTAFFGQAAPDSGAAEGANVTLHAGFLAPGSAGILDDAMFVNANFLATSYQTMTLSALVVDASPTPPTGTATFTLDEDGTTLNYDISVSDLSGPVIGAHFHNAAAGFVGPVVFSITGDVTQFGATATIQGSVALTPTQLAAVRAGEYYINVHTSLNPAGEIRGQVTPGN
jgi:hypothetical protein